VGKLLLRQFDLNLQLLNLNYKLSDNRAQGLSMVPWDVYIMPNDKGGLGLIDVATQGSILTTKWVVRYLEGTSLGRLCHGID
jgi:hypothetical protein